MRLLRQVLAIDKHDVRPGERKAGQNAMGSVLHQDVASHGIDGVRPDAAQKRHRPKPAAIQAQQGFRPNS